MQLISLVALLLTGSALALPSHPTRDAALAKRACFELKGKALKICQGICIAGCDAVTDARLKGLCKTACTARPLKIRTEEKHEEHAGHDEYDDDDEDDDEYEEGHEGHAGHEAGHEQKAAAVEVRTTTVEQEELEKLDSFSYDDLVALGTAASVNSDDLGKRSKVGHGACIAGCELLCNSTVLALAQKKCLADCVSGAASTHL